MEHLDFEQPIALALLSVLPDIADDERAHQYVRRLCGPLAEGSFLAATHDTLGYHDEGKEVPPPRIGAVGESPVVSVIDSAADGACLECAGGRAVILLGPGNPVGDLDESGHHQNESAHELQDFLVVSESPA
jgi:hypothetical protein